MWNEWESARIDERRDSNTIARRERKRCVILLCAAICNTVYRTPILCLTVWKMVSIGCVINYMHTNNVHAFFECLLNRIKQQKMSISCERVAQMVMLIEQGISTREVNRRFGCDHQTVSHIYRQYVETGSFTHRPHWGHARVTTTIREDHRFIRLVQQDPFHTLSYLVAQMTTQANFNASRCTVHWWLQQQGMRSRRPATGPASSRFCPQSRELDRHQLGVHFIHRWVPILSTGTGWPGSRVAAPWRALQARKFRSTVELLGQFHNGFGEEFRVMCTLTSTSAKRAQLPHIHILRTSFFHMLFHSLGLSVQNSS